MPDKPPATIFINEATTAQRVELRELMLTTMAANPMDEHLTSFKHELTVGADLGERFVEYAVSVDGALGGRCKINFQPQADDINAYGVSAAALYIRERLATLAGDLVFPAYRGLGLQSQMIDYRLALLATAGFTYAMCGILAGNDVSRMNYLRHGFEPLGVKTINWGAAAIGKQMTEVTLYGHPLDRSI